MPTPSDVLGPGALGLATYDRLSTLLAGIGPSTVRLTKSQIAFRRRRGFAYLWAPPAWARNRADVVLSIALPQDVASARWKQIAHPSPGIWMHHLEIRDVADLDDEVVGWLHAAYDAAA